MTEFDKRHRAALAAFAVEIQALYDISYDEIARLVRDTHLSPESRFTFRGNKKISEATDSLLGQLAEATTAATLAGVGGAWNLSNEKNDAITKSFIHDRQIPERYLNHNHVKLAEFQKRRIWHHTLSTRVWSLTKASKVQIEFAINEAIQQGTSATQLSRNIRQYLNDPDRLFRRVRDEYGNLVPSRAMRAFQPGAGIYKSSYKNALRLAKNEINTAYRLSDQERYLQQDFVIGKRIALSAAHPQVDICDDMQGDYPKDFYWTGWHVACICVCTPILARENEFIAYLNGDRHGFSGQRTAVPSDFNQYVRGHANQIGQAIGRGKEPYWVRENLGKYITL